VEAAASRALAFHGRIAYVERPKLPVFVPSTGQRPPDWGLIFGDSLLLSPRGPSGSVRGKLRVELPGRYTAWMEASVDRPFPVWLGHRRVGTVGPRQLGPPAQFLSVGAAVLPKGEVAVRIVRPGNSLAPGDGGTTRTIGPLVLQAPTDTQTVRYIDPTNVRQLCGRRLDWIEIVR
jgi:hypothetical protein